MAKHLLVIDRDDEGEFFLSIEAGTLTIGGTLTDAAVVLQDLHISRIRCEFEVEEDLVVIGHPETPSDEESDTPPLRQELHPGEAVQMGPSHIRLETAAAEKTAKAVAPASSDGIPGLALEIPEKGTAQPTAPAAAKEGGLIKRLIVIDGADQGRFFPLPDTGIIAIGNSHKCADIVLHDLYVARVHCRLQMEDDTVIVTHVGGQSNTRINGEPITQKVLQVGDVLRVGNSHLRLETMLEDKAATESEEDAEALEVAEDEDGLEVVEDEDALEVVEEEGALEVVEEEAVLHAEPAEDLPPTGESYSLPHPAVDQLLKLENGALGRYQISRLLGRGQSSAVFRAQEVKSNQVVALKVISADFPSSDAELQRFVKALKVTMNLQHAHLTTLFGAGKTGGYCWVAREYVEGVSVSRLLKKIEDGGKSDWTSACRIAVHLGQALDFLHRRKVTHGNITPRNILIRHGDRTTKLTDLMLNQALHGSRLQKAILGKKLLAELAYMAPEQTDPHAFVDPVADLYALGTVLYALLTGQPPFTGTSPREVLTQVREGKVVRPSKFQRGIPADFEGAVLKMMARRQEDRFQTATEMLEVVEPIAEEHDVEV